MNKDIMHHNIDSSTQEEINSKKKPLQSKATSFSMMPAPNFININQNNREPNKTIIDEHKPGISSERSMINASLLNHYSLQG